MFTKKLISAAVATGALALSTLAHAGYVQTPITINPQGDSVSASGSQFTAAGMQSNLFSTLNIAGNTGSGVAFTETGHIDVTSFQDAAANAIAGTGLGTGWSLSANINLSGTGSWSGGTYTADNAGFNFTINLVATNLSTATTVNLGQASVIPGTVVGFAIAFGSLAPLTTGSALTSLSANMAFTPAAGTQGTFFIAPNPFNVVFAVGNAGGNSLNTGYSVDASGNVTVTTPIPGTTNSGTANVTFATAVPEPGALSLVGLALVGAAVVGRRRKATQATA